MTNHLSLSLRLFLICGIINSHFIDSVFSKSSLLQNSGKHSDENEQERGDQSTAKLEQRKIESGPYGDFIHENFFGTYENRTVR